MASNVRPLARSCLDVTYQITAKLYQSNKPKISQIGAELAKMPVALPKYTVYHMLLHINLHVAVLQFEGNQVSYYDGGIW